MQSQLAVEGLCLRYPQNIGQHPAITYEAAIQMLLRAIPMAEDTPFQWTHIDKPPDFQAYLLFVPPGMGFPNDGLRYLEPEQKYTIPAGPQRELEVSETKFGFIPGSGETVAYRQRKRYRLSRGGHPQLVLVHYIRGPPQPIPPSLMNQPVRNYPLRELREPPVFVTGSKLGRKVPPDAAGLPPLSAPPPPFGAAALGNPQAMLAQQNANMEALERRNRGASVAAKPPGVVPRVEDDDSGDEGDQISTRALASARYRRNHEFMNDVFMYAAYGDRLAQAEPPSYASLFNENEIKEKTVKLESELQELEAKAAAREQSKAKSPAGDGDVSMENIGASPQHMITD